jgi:hypothetical protein
VGAAEATPTTVRCCLSASARRSAPLPADSPSATVSGGRPSPQGRAHDARAFAVSAWMRCRRTSADVHASAGQDARRALPRGALLLGYLLLGKQEKVTGPQGCGTNMHGRGSVFAKTRTSATAQHHPPTEEPLTAPGAPPAHSSHEPSSPQPACTPGVRPDDACARDDEHDDYHDDDRGTGARARLILNATAPSHAREAGRSDTALSLATGPPPEAFDVPFRTRHPCRAPVG